MSLILLQNIFFALGIIPAINDSAALIAYAKNHKHLYFDFSGLLRLVTYVGLLSMAMLERHGFITFS